VIINDMYEAIVENITLDIFCQFISFVPECKYIVLWEYCI